MTVAAPSCEIAWFAALCDDDAEFLGVRDPALLSSFEHCRDIALAAEQSGFDQILLPSGYALGIDTMTFAAGVAPLTSRIRLLAAIRCGEMWPPQQARQIASLDRMLGGRLAINIISSDLPGETLDAEQRYARTRTTMSILRTLLDGEPVSRRNEHDRLEVQPPRIGTTSGRSPLFYFGGLSEPARDTAAAGADVYLMWPDRFEQVAAVMGDMRRRAAVLRRRLRFGYRVHVVVRETESAARDAAARLLSRLDEREGALIRSRSLDSHSVGVRRQGELREAAGADGYVEANLWTGIGRARSGCGAAIVGDPDQVLAKLEAYRDLGIEAFILSGYPHRQECDLFARHVLPRLPHAAI